MGVDNYDSICKSHWVHSVLNQNIFPDCKLYLRVLPFAITLESNSVVENNHYHKKRRNMKINLRKTIENTVTVCDEFPFYVEELSPSGEMPTLLGMADEKYSFSEMDDEFFDFVSRKVHENGIYIRLIHIIEKESDKSHITFEIETGLEKTTIKTQFSDLDEVTDIGIKIQGSDITVGTTKFSKRPHFERIDENFCL